MEIGGVDILELLTQAGAIGVLVAWLISERLEKKAKDTALLEAYKENAQQSADTAQAIRDLTAAITPRRR